MAEKIYDLLIIGGGPSGINVAISAAKAGLDYRILEKGAVVNSLYNFPVNMTFFSTSLKLEIHGTPFISHRDKPTRSEALEYYRRLIQSYDLQVNLYEEVESMEPVGADAGAMGDLNTGQANPTIPAGSPPSRPGSSHQADPDAPGQTLYRLQTNQATYLTRAVCVATGFYDTPRYLDIPGGDLPKVRHYYDDPHAYINQDVLVVGAANSACDAALETWRKGARVTMAIRGQVINDRVKYWIKPDIENRIKEGSIPAYFGTTLTAIRPGEVDLQTPDGPLTLKNDWVLAMTGYTPNYDLFERLGIPVGDDDACKPLLNPDTLETQLPNVFMAGVACAGKATSKLFIENTRDHGDIIVSALHARTPSLSTALG